MTEKKNGRLRRYIMPGLIFQSVVISGGYGTGSELSQFFLKYGTVGGMLGLCVVTLAIWALVCAVTFEFARVFRSFDYKSLFQKLLGQGWVFYEICYWGNLVICLAVISATAGISAETVFGVSRWVGVLVMGGCIMLLVLKGTAAIEKFLSLWSYFLYIVYAIFLITCIARFGARIGEQLFVAPQIQPGWAAGGVKYALYNLGIIPAVLFSTRDAHSRKEAMGSGIIAAVIAVIPAVLMLISMSGLYPEILGAEVPVSMLFEELNTPVLQYVFQIVLFGTLIETGSGLIKAVTDRFESGRPEMRSKRGLIAFVCVASGILLSTFGLTDLVQKGYGSIAWCFLFVYVIPMLTVGVVKIVRAGRHKRRPGTRSKHAKMLK